MNMSIDRLTFCGNEDRKVELFYENSDFVKNKGFAKYPYRDCITFLDGSILQIAEKEAARSGKIKELRYEFNPNNKIFEKSHLSVLKLMKDVHVTRIDIAFDIRDVDMSKWKWIDSKGRVSNVWYDGLGNVETYYIGGRESEMKVRIYNKAKEQKLKDETWWRVEVQLRGKTAENFRKQSLKGFSEINPFNDIVPVVDGEFPELPIKERAMVKYLLEYPSGFDELSVNSRTKYKKLIQGLASWETIDLRKEWNEKSSDVASELASWYNFTNQNV